MIHHVSLELDEHDVAAEVAFWELLGFTEMTPPGALAERARWVERGDVQLHLMYAQTPSIPRAGPPLGCAGSTTGPSSTGPGASTSAASATS